MQTLSTPTLLSTTLRASAEYSVPVQLDLKDGSTERVPAFIRRVKSGFFQLSTPVFLQQDTRIDMVSGKHTFEIEVGLDSIKLMDYGRLNRMLFKLEHR